MSLLKTSGVSMEFGGLVAVSDLNLEIGENQIYGLIGPNGAGKTTAFNMITGVYRPTRGSISFDNNDITGLESHKITKSGIARTFQNIRLFKDMNVIENVMAANHLRLKSTMIESVLGLPRYKKEEKEIYQKSEDLLEKLGLKENIKDSAISLPYGKQRRLEIARALATNPKLLLLDEPAAGMNPKESIELMDFIAQIKEDFKISVLMIEHHMQVVMGVCEKISVLDYGKTIACGSPREIQKDKSVIEAYLGVD